MASTVAQVLDRTAESHGDKIALRVSRSGRTQVLTWGMYRSVARQAARAMMALGLPPGQAISLIGANTPEWVLADVAAILAGGRPAGIYTTSSPAQCKYICEHSESPLIFADADHIEKIVSIRNQLPTLRAIIQMTGNAVPDGVLSWNDFLRAGAAVTETELDARIARQSSTDICTLIYTSGTTGDPKAVMLTHENITWSALCIKSKLGFTHEERVVSYLPLSHVAEQILSVHGPMLLGSSVTFAPSVDAVLDLLREVRPTYFMGVPRVWEKMEAKMKAAIAKAPRHQREITAWAQRIGTKAGRAKEAGRAAPLLLPLAKRIVFKNVLGRLGLDACVMPVTGAAPIARSTLEFFQSMGLSVFEVYGMSECTGGATLSSATGHRLGKAGHALPGSEVKIAEDGEICIRGKHVFAGYFKDEASTQVAVDAEGWLHTGDIGVLDAADFLQITDRKKDLLITAGGENIAPQVLESRLKAISVVAQAVVIGDRRKFLTALVTLDLECLEAFASSANSAAREPLAASQCPKFQSYLMQQVELINQSLARVQTIKKVTILAQDFSVDSGELTPTMKVKRKVVNEKYRTQIDVMYSES